MKDKILTNRMTDVETGKTTNIAPSQWLSNGYGLNAIIKIMCVKSYFHDTREVKIDCLALDCQGEVFKLNLCFMPQSLNEEQNIISEIAEGKILVVSGRYCVLPKKESIITLYDPQYFSLPPEYSIEEVGEVFRFNITSMIKDIHKAAKRGNEFARRNLDYIYEQGHTEAVKSPMENSMKDNILTGTMTNAETGETRDLEPFYMFFNNCQLNAIAKIQCVKSYFHETKEVQIACWALDCQGNVFKLHLYFLPKSLDEEQKIISEITEGKILVVSGRFTVIQTECNVTLYDVEYYPLPSEISLEEAEEVFRCNSASMIKDIHEAAEQGDIDRQIELGYMYVNGEGVPQDYSEAAKWLLMAAEQGDVKAQYLLGCMYDEGQSVQQDFTEALKWYHKAAEQGHTNAQVSLGYMYAEVEGVPHDYEEALKWYRIAVEKGNATAQVNLGWMYDEGKGVQQDFTEALKWYHKAAEQKNAIAQYNIGDMYKKGKGVPQAFDEAAKWFRMSAEGGYADAQLELNKIKEEDTVMDMLMGAGDVSLNELIGADSENFNMKSLAFEGENQEESLIQNEERNLFKQNITEALSGLNEKEAYIIINRVMADYPETLQEISDKYNITQEQARQIEKQALKKMQQALPLLK